MSLIERGLPIGYTRGRGLNDSDAFPPVLRDRWNWVDQAIGQKIRLQRMKSMKTLDVRYLAKAAWIVVATLALPFSALAQGEAIKDGLVGGICG